LFKFQKSVVIKQIILSEITSDNMMIKDFKKMVI